MSNIFVFKTPKLWMESNAIQQLEQVVQLPDMVAGIGLPDLHLSKYGPVGSALLSKDTFYPHLIGTDIGCGFLLAPLQLPHAKINRERTVRTLQNFDAYREVVNEDWQSHHLAPRNEDAMCTLGSGNHFCELSKLTLLDKSYALSEEASWLLVHTGSRNLGTQILGEFTALGHTANVGLGHALGRKYLSEHAYALAWGQMNRELLARQFATTLHTKVDTILTNAPHNFLDTVNWQGKEYFLHRKGANANTGLFVVAGSRGTHSYLCAPGPKAADGLWSVSHGCGRKYRRSDMQGRIEETAQSLRRTEIGSHVVCAKKSLLYEEAPQAYKSIEQVMETLIHFQLVHPVAQLTPIINFKTLEADQKYQK